MEKKMSNLFFEGFNNQNTANKKFDENYWSTPDLSKIELGAGRTGNQIYLRGRPVASGLSDSTVITLSNFIDPLVNNSGFALGFYTDLYSVKTNNDSAPPPYAEKLIEFYNGSEEVLRIDIIKTTYNSTNSLGFGIYQNNVLVDTYDLKSFNGYSWIIYNQDNTMSVGYPSYIEFYIDPKLNNEMCIRFSANNTKDASLRNTSNNIFTAISGFSNLTSIKIYGTNDTIGGPTSYRRTIDDFYICGGNDTSGCLLGSDTRIYRLNLNGDSSTQEWYGQSYGSVSQSSYWHVSSDDADESYIFSSTIDDESSFDLSNLPNDAPSNISGIKIINIARKSSLSQNSTIINIVTSGNNTESLEIGNPSGHYIDSDQYSSKTEFIFFNPFTGSGWTKQEINDLQLGVKYKG